MLARERIQQYMDKHNVSVSKACDALKLSPSNYYYHSRKVNKSLTRRLNHSISIAVPTPTMQQRMMVMIGSPDQIKSLFAGALQ